MDQDRLIKPIGLGRAIRAIVAWSVLGWVAVNALAADAPKAASVATRPAPSGAGGARPVMPAIPRATTKPADLPKLTVAVVQGQVVFQRFNRSADLQEQLTQLNRSAVAARQSNDPAKFNEITQKLNDFRQDTRKLLVDAIEFVAKREGCEAVFGDLWYAPPGVKVADLTGDVIEHLNSTTTAPASIADVERDANKPSSLSAKTKVEPAARVATKPAK